MNENAYIGYLRYCGKLVEDGFFDARKSAGALIGLDEAVRFFVGEQVPSLKQVDFEFPVLIRNGSWEVLIPKAISTLIVIGGVFGTSYALTAGKKMAENDFEDKGFKDVFRKAVEAIQWVIRIGKHTGNLNQKKFNDTKFRKDNQEIGITNEQGIVLFIPKFFFDLYQTMNPKILSKIAEPVEEERILTVGVFDNIGNSIEESLPRRFRPVFTQEDTEPEEELFPELKHGQIVSLEGDITRGNETTNSIGLRYKGHILTCEPESGSIKRFKATLFEKARVFGTISRMDKFGKTNLTKPKIIIDRIEPLVQPQDNLTLFDKDK